MGRMARQGHARRRHEEDDGRPAHGSVHTRQPAHALRRQAHDLRRLRAGGRSEGLSDRGDAAHRGRAMRPRGACHPAGLDGLSRRGRRCLKSGCQGAG
ncbi:hypothetical protein RA210_U210058 [Rubrivivax sp. A210]|nr:hypothetical protein RA210_U210058 [Rubrivivax sp. A210]